MRTVGDLMTRDLDTVAEFISIGACQEVMLANRYRHLPVVGDDGELVGLATDLEVLASAREGDYERWVTEVCRDVERPAHAHDSAISTLARMVAERRDAVVVVDGRNRPIGIFTDHDALELGRLVLKPWQTVGELAKPHALFAVRPGKPADEALAMMRRHRIRHLLIVQEGQLTGLISASDCVGRDSIPVDNLRPVSRWEVRTDTPLHAAIDTMIEHRIGILPVLNERGSVVSVLTRTDVLRALAKQLLDASIAPAADRMQGQSDST